MPCPSLDLPTRKKLMAWWNGLKAASRGQPSRWLVQRQGIFPEVIDRFAASIRAEPSRDKVEKFRPLISPSDFICLSQISS
jgi:hypothetical protein